MRDDKAVTAPPGVREDEFSLGAAISRIQLLIGSRARVQERWEARDAKQRARIDSLLKDTIQRIEAGESTGDMLLDRFVRATHSVDNQELAAYRLLQEQLAGFCGQLILVHCKRSINIAPQIRNVGPDAPRGSARRSNVIASPREHWVTREYFSLGRLQTEELILGKSSGRGCVFVFPTGGEHLLESQVRVGGNELGETSVIRTNLPIPETLPPRRSLANSRQVLVSFRPTDPEGGRVCEPDTLYVGHNAVKSWFYAHRNVAAFLTCSMQLDET